ncbi:MAG TPA: lauroyl acyltransferase [Magnetospirillaceae bacterium]|jgi:KDO2-lipid IV(A) lauroyltransferase
MTRTQFRNRIEAVIARIVFTIFQTMPVDIASAIGGWFGRNLGYRLPVTRRARRNLAMVYPAMGEGEREALLLRMWDNLGRTAAEFAHLHRMRIGPGERIEVDGIEHVRAAQAVGKGIIFFSAHCANWEMFGPLAKSAGLTINLVYRAPNNPYLDWLFSERGKDVGTEMIPKGSVGARRVMQILLEKQVLGLLLDQKMNDGIPVPFFGRDAMTAPAVAQFALKYGCPVVPAHVIRLKGARFRLVVEPPIDIAPSSDRHGDILRVMTEVNRIIEGWIRAHPDQWLWVHRRWPD